MTAAAPDRHEAGIRSRNRPYKLLLDLPAYSDAGPGLGTESWPRQAARPPARPTRPNPDRRHHKHADTSTASAADSCANNVVANIRNRHASTRNEAPTVNGAEKVTDDGNEKAGTEK